MIYFKPIVYDASVHRPLGTGEAIDPTTLPTSARLGNTVIALEDGIYVGPYLDEPTYYVAASGVDDPESGSKAAPYQTLDYCMQQMNAKSSNVPYFSSVVNIALKAGEQFAFNNPFLSGGQITFTFFGDPQYGDFDSPFVGTPPYTDPAVMADLQRPIIKPSTHPSNGLACVRLQLSPLGLLPSVALRGVRLDLPVKGPLLGDSDFVVTFPDVSGRCTLFGAIVNITDTTAEYGVFGAAARANLSTLSQYASQFWVNGAIVVAGAAPDVLIARKYFVKFYSDFAGNHQIGYTFAGNPVSASPGSSIMQVNWTETASLPVMAGKFNLATYPLNSDVGFGLRNYFLNITRDQQQRPLNVLSAFLM